MCHMSFNNLCNIMHRIEIVLKKGIFFMQNTIYIIYKKKIKKIIHPNKL